MVEDENKDNVDIENEVKVETENDQKTDMMEVNPETKLVEENEKEDDLKTVVTHEDDNNENRLLSLKRGVYNMIMHTIFYIGIAVFVFNMFRSISISEATIERNIDTSKMQIVKEVKCPSCGNKAKYYITLSDTYVLRCDDCKLTMEFIK